MSIAAYAPQERSTQYAVVPPSAHRQLLLEAHSGQALCRLEELPLGVRHRLVVVTPNPCPEYALDLWNLGPKVLIWGTPIDLEMRRSLEGKPVPLARSCWPHGLASALLPSERAILRFLPLGLGDKSIAHHLQLSHRTVRNRLVSIFEKLQLENRTQAALYYSGQWHWLEAYRGRLRDQPWQHGFLTQLCAAD